MHSYKLHWHCIMNHAQWPPVKSTFLIISAVISVPEPETFYVSACRVANSSRGWYVQRCSQRQVSNPQTSVTVLRSKITSSATKSIDSTQNFPHENWESFVHRRPTVWRTDSFQSVRICGCNLWAIILYRLFYDRDGKPRISFHKDALLCAIFNPQ